MVLALKSAGNNPVSVYWVPMQSQKVDHFLDRVVLCGALHTIIAKIASGSLASRVGGA